MKKLISLILPVILILVISHNPLISQDNNKNKTTAPAKTSKQVNSQVKQINPAHQQMIINMNRPSSGEHNRNYPSQQHPALLKINNMPAYGKLQLTPENQVKQHIRNNPQPQVNNKPAIGKPQLMPENQAKQQIRNNPQPQPVSKPFHSKNDQSEVKTDNKLNQQQNVNTASVKHHHAFEPNYIRKKLKKIGVVSEPGYIVNREEVINTDRAHSIIAFPKEGFDKRPLNAAAFSARRFNDTMIRSHMSLIDGIDWQDRIHGFNQTETRPNFYYWHKENNFNYCHFIDNSGYHWYGWYVENNYFWTRYFNNRWWWYDVDYDRWCFWNDGFWWWQDPYHMGDLYCYNDSDYIPCNSADDNVAVTVPDNNNIRTFASPDNSRIVKVVADTEDAFLYDTSNPPAFKPFYLASGVQDVMFSDPRNGKPLEIILKLSDLSFDIFDSNGNPYSPVPAEDSQSNETIQ